MNPETTMDPIDVNNLDEFTTAYIETALWSSTCSYRDVRVAAKAGNLDAKDIGKEDKGREDIPLDEFFGAENIAPETLAEMVADCLAFQAEHADDIADDPSRSGHDFWLTRNGHGAGFWDGDWDDEVGARLTEAAHLYGSVDLYIGDDGRIYG